jgi:hypothetical protein
VYLVLKDKPRKRIGIPSNLERYSEIVQWLDAHLTNLDALEFKAEEAKILEDADLGATPDERQEKLERARRRLKQARWVALAVSFWTLVYPAPYELAIAVTALLPIAGIVLVIRSHGLVRIDDDARGVHPSAWVLMIPGAALAFRAFADYNMVDYNDIWFPAGAVLAVLGGLLFWSASEYRKRPAQFLSVLFFLAFYSYGLTVQINCLLDTSEPTIHPVKVLNKRESKDRYKLLYFTVSPWGERPSDNEIQVSRPVYNAVRVGDTVHVKEKSGLVGIRWFYTRQQHDQTNLQP